MLKVGILDIGYLFLLMVFVPRKVVLLKKDDLVLESGFKIFSY